MQVHAKGTELARVRAFSSVQRCVDDASEIQGTAKLSQQHRRQSKLTDSAASQAPLSPAFHMKAGIHLHAAVLRHG